MDRKPPYNFWKVDSELYLHVKASTRAAEDAEPHATHAALLCECVWNDRQGQCNFTTDTVANVLTHISSCHLRGYPQSDTHVQCQCRGCTLRRPIRRDTVLRHVREIHYADKYRRKN
ncbi:hypothetical protein M405DRAFT_880089 [Rhizopogon salebrosus TDB-379]|nr:hypothetical protein M405DRAFT_880089 [Rhizopogon salebrosus TDB-379]